MLSLNRASTGQGRTSNLEVGVFTFNDTSLADRAVGSDEFAGLGQIVVNAARVYALDHGFFAEGHRQRVGDGTERLHGTVSVRCIDGVLGIPRFFKDRQEVIQLIGRDHVERRANRRFEFTRRLVDLLHEAVLAEVLDQALVAVKDGSDVFVAGFELHHGVGQDTSQGLDLALLLYTLVVDGAGDEQSHQHDGEADEVTRAEQATGCIESVGFLVDDLVGDVVLRGREVG